MTTLARHPRLHELAERALHELLAGIGCVAFLIGFLFESRFHRCMVIGVVAVVAVVAAAMWVF